jgi:hypothetical protein
LHTPDGRPDSFHERTPAAYIHHRTASIIQAVLASPRRAGRSLHVGTHHEG